jgi:8-oxo-dGTP diphosphatase
MALPGGALSTAAVVGAAIVRVGPDGVARLLVGQRSAPPVLRGRWELPGGKVEPVETEPGAVVRECREELGVDIEVGARVGADLDIGGGRVLRAYAATLLAGEPTATDHLAVRWVGAEDIAGLDWLPADRALLPALTELLARASRAVG